MFNQFACASCGARHEAGRTCEDDFHQMLFWEAEDPALGAVHHLMVLCYHIQHPALYSPDGLKYSIGLLRQFVETGALPEDVRKRIAPQVDWGKRSFKVKGTPDSHGSFEKPVQWEMTASSVVLRGKAKYVESVKDWARSVMASLRASDNVFEDSTGH